MKLKWLNVLRSKGAPHAIGETIAGFNFYRGKAYTGKIIRIKRYTMYGYVLDSGTELGPHDDIYSSKDVQS